MIRQRQVTAFAISIGLAVLAVACDSPPPTPTPRPGPAGTPTVGIVGGSTGMGGTICRGSSDADCTPVNPSVTPEAPSYDNDLVGAEQTGTLRVTSGDTRVRLLPGARMRLVGRPGLGSNFLLRAGYALFDHRNSSDEIEVGVGDGTPPLIRIQPVGTRFSVGRAASGSVQVAVIAGSLVMTTSTGYHLTLPDAAQHPQVRFDPQGVPGTPYPLDADTARLWRYYGGGADLNVAAETTDAGNCPPDRVAVPGLDMATRARLGCPVEEAHRYPWTAATAQRFQSGTLYYDPTQATVYALYIPSGAVQARGWESSSLPALPATGVGAARPDLDRLLGATQPSCAQGWTIQRFAGGTVIAADADCAGAVAGGAILYSGGWWEPLPSGSGILPTPTVPPPAPSASPSATPAPPTLSATPTDTPTRPPPGLVLVEVSPKLVRYGPCGEGSGTVMIQATVSSSAEVSGVRARFRRSLNNDPADDLVVPLRTTGAGKYTVSVSADRLASAFLSSGSGTIAYQLEAIAPTGVVITTQGGTLQIELCESPTITPTLTPPSPTATDTRGPTVTHTATVTPTRTATPTQPRQGPTGPTTGSVTVTATLTVTRTATLNPGAPDQSQVTVTATLSATPIVPQFYGVGHTPESLDYYVQCNHLLTVRARLSDPSSQVVLLYRYHSTNADAKPGGEHKVVMTGNSDGGFQVTIDISLPAEAPADMILTPQQKPVYTEGTVDYYILAYSKDGGNQSRTFTVPLTYGSCR